MEITGLIDGSNVNHDYQFSGIADALLSGSCVVSGLAVTTGQVAAGKALIKCTRTNGQVFYATYQNTAAVAIDTTGTKVVFVAISQAEIDDGSTNNADGTAIATIQTAASYPATGGYVPLASIATSAITDARPFYIKRNNVSSPIASSSAIDFSSLSGDVVHITGTNAITSLGLMKSGTYVNLIFDGVLTLTHNATSLILPTGANISTSAGDSAGFISEGSGNWRCISYQKVNGQALSAATDVNGLTEDTTPDTDADFLLEYDTSAALNKKIKISSLRASDAEALAGTNTKKYITPKQAADNYASTIVPSDVRLAISSAGIYVYSNTTYTKVKEMVCNKSGTYRIKFYLGSYAGGSAPFSYATIYKNGVAFGSEISTSASTPVQFSQDLAFTKGDLIQLYIKSSSGWNANASNFELCGNSIEISAIPTVNI